MSERVEGWTLVAGSEIRIGFEGSHFWAGAGCNSMSGNYSMQGDTLVVGGFSITEMGCGPTGQHEQDVWLMEFLMAKPTLSFAEPRLTMATSDARIDLVDREIASPDRPLVGTRWEGQGFSDGEVATMGPGGELVSAYFDPDGNATFFTSCQHGAGEYSVQGATITFQSLVFDGAACTENYQLSSDQALLVLDGSPLTFAIEERKLVLSNANNQLWFRSAE